MPSGDELIRLTAREAVTLLAKGEVTPLELIDAALARIEAVEPAVNALPTLCVERARDHAKRLMARRDLLAGGARGWLAGLPVAIKDLTDVAGVRTTYGSPIYADHVPETSHPLVEGLERNGGVVLAKSNTPEFGAGGSTFNEVFGRTRNPWNTSLTCGGSSGGAAVALATGEIWLAHGSDHGGSLRGPASFCSVVGLRPSPGRVTRGTANNLFSASSVQGPMARNVPDIALFLDALCGRDRADPLSIAPPATSFLDEVLDALKKGKGGAPKRVAWTPDLGGAVPVARETQAICATAARRFEELGSVVEEASPDMGRIGEAFQIIRAMIFLVDRGPLMETHRDQLKPDIIWNTEKGMALKPVEIAWAERERAALYRRMVKFFETYDVLVCPTSVAPAFDVNLRHRTAIDGVKLENYIAGSVITSGISMTACPAISVPCGFDSFGRPVGLQIIGAPQDEAGVLRAAALYERLAGFDRQLPIDPRDGTVPDD